MLASLCAFVNTPFGRFYLLLGVHYFNLIPINIDVCVCLGFLAFTLILFRGLPICTSGNFTLSLG